MPIQRTAAARSAAAPWSALFDTSVGAVESAPAVSGFKRARSSSVDASDDDDEAGDEHSSSFMTGAAGPASKRLCVGGFGLLAGPASLLPIDDDDHDDEVDQDTAFLAAGYLVPGTGVSSGYQQWSVLPSAAASGVMPQPTGTVDADADELELPDLDFS